MAKGGKFNNGKGNSQLTLDAISLDPYFALATQLDPLTGLPVVNPLFTSLLSSIPNAPVATYDYVYAGPKNASSAGQISIAPGLTAMNGAISTGNGKDRVNLSSSEADNFISTGNGKDVAIGGSGNDTIDTGNANDEVSGGLDNGLFSLSNDPSTDTNVIFLEAGDTLSGGRGKDIFRYSLGDGVDVITDFTVGQDKLLLDEIALGDLILISQEGDLYIGFDDGAGQMLENNVIVLNNVEDSETFVERAIDFV